MIFLEKYYSFTENLLLEARRQQLEASRFNAKEFENARLEFINLSSDEFIRHFATVAIWDLKLRNLAAEIIQEKEQAEELITQQIGDAEGLAEVLYNLKRPNQPLEGLKYHDIFSPRGSKLETVEQLNSFAELLNKAKEEEKDLTKATYRPTIRRKAENKAGFYYQALIAQELSSEDLIAVDLNDLGFEEFLDSDEAQELRSVTGKRFLDKESVLKALSFKYRFKIPSSAIDRNTILREIGEGRLNEDERMKEDDFIYRQLIFSWMRQNHRDSEIQRLETELEQVRSSDPLSDYVTVNNAIFGVLEIAETKQGFLDQYGVSMSIPNIVKVLNDLDLPFKITNSMVERVLGVKGGEISRLGFDTLSTTNTKGQKIADLSFFPRTQEGKRLDWNDVMLENVNGKLKKRTVLT